MRKLLAVMYIALLFWLFSISYGNAQTVNTPNITFAWDANDPSEGVTGYKLHVGNATRQYTRAVDAGNVTVFTVPGFTDGVWFIAATAYDAAGNSSDYSNEVMVTVDSTAPSGVKNFRFKAVSKGD